MFKRKGMGGGSKAKLSVCRTLLHQDSKNGQFGTKKANRQFCTKIRKRTIWHQHSDKTKIVLERSATWMTEENEKEEKEEKKEKRGGGERGKEGEKRRRRRNSCGPTNRR